MNSISKAHIFLKEILQLDDIRIVNGTTITTFVKETSIGITPVATIFLRPNKELMYASRKYSYTSIGDLVKDSNRWSTARLDGIPEVRVGIETTFSSNNTILCFTIINSY